MILPVTGASEVGRERDSFNVGYVEISAQSERVSITHNGRAAVVRRGRWGKSAVFDRDAQLAAKTPRRARNARWLAKAVSSLAADFRRLVMVPRRTGAPLQPIE